MLSYNNEHRKLNLEAYTELLESEKEFIISPKTVKSIIKFQNLFRTYIANKKKLSNIKGKCENEKLGEQALDYIENYKFPNGAIYTGILL